MIESTLETFVAEIAALYGKDFDFAFKKQIESSVIGFRASLLKQEYDRNGRFPTASIDFIKLKLKSVSANECCIDSEETQCSVMRTEVEVPNPVRSNTNPEPFLFVGTARQEKEYTFINPEDLKDIIDGTRFMRNAIFYTHYNDYIFVIVFGEGSINGKVGIRFVPANPTQLLELTDCDGKPCKEEIHIEEDLKKTIRQMIIEDINRSRGIFPSKEVKLNESQS